MSPAGPLTIAQALALARTLGVDKLDAQLLVAHHTGRTRAGVIAWSEAELPPEQAQAISAALARRAAGEPLAYLVGQREFHGMNLHVTPAVLVPRPDTETLVDWALELLKGLPAKPAVVDLGTGSGAIALAVKRTCPDARLLAVDASGEALEVARANAQRLGLDVEFRCGDWWEPVAGLRFHLVLSNPPYIAEGDPHLANLTHEPQRALTAGADGLDDLRRIVAGAPAHLAPGGWLLLEHGHDQGSAVRDLLLAGGLHAVVTKSDLAGRERCTGGCLAPP